MTFQSTPKITGKSDVVEFVLSVKRLNPLTSPDIAPDHILIFTQRFVRNVF